jgi:hypothetical protein
MSDNKFEPVSDSPAERLAIEAVETIFTPSPTSTLNNTTSLVSTHPPHVTDSSDSMETARDPNTCDNVLGLVDYFGHSSGDNLMDFEHSSAQQRVAYCQQALQGLERIWGPIDCWGNQFAGEWENAQFHGDGHFNQWLDSVREKVRVGETLLGYLGCVMQGELPQDVEGLRDVWIQGHQLTTSISGGVFELQHRLAMVQQCNSLFTYAQ